MSSKRRRETAELYAEMYEQGYNPSRGLGPVFAIMLIGSIIAIVLIMIFFRENLLNFFLFS